MRKNLERISLQVPIGNITPSAADDIVANGDGISLKGRAVLLLSTTGLERLLQNLAVNPETAALIVRMAKLLESKKPADARVEADRAAAPTANADLGQSEGIR